MNDKLILEKTKGFKFYNDVTMITPEDLKENKIIKFVSAMDKDRYLRLKGYEFNTIVIECFNYKQIQYNIFEFHKKLQECNIHHNYSLSNSQITIIEK